jgi:phosphoglycolate phosphatase-like HAD superfamily hydrolase
MVDREGSVSSRGGGNENAGSSSMSPSTSADNIAQQAIDNLFSRTFEKSDWQPAKPPAVLGELLDSRHMLPLLLPSDPMHLGALPVIPKDRHGKRESGFHGLLSVNSPALTSNPGSRSHSRAGSEVGSRSASRASISVRGAMEWISRTRKLRTVDKTMLKNLGDDEVTSELEAIAAKWRFAWANLAAVDGATEDHHHEPQQGLHSENKEVDQDQEDHEMPQIEEDPEELETQEITVGSPKLTLEPVRMVKEMRRRSMIQDKF